ncbi:hypothetical protein FRB90_012081, partial [Tulasnella sp. 427]
MSMLTTAESEKKEEQRIRVSNEHGECLGYLGPAKRGLPSYWEGFLNASCDEDEAFRVTVHPSTDGTKLARLFVVGHDKWLGIQWEESAHSRAAIALFERTSDGMLTSKLPSHRWDGAARTTVWDIGADGSIVPRWVSNKGYYETFGFIAHEATHLVGGTTIIHVKSKAQSYALRNAKWDLATLELED